MRHVQRPAAAAVAMALAPLASHAATYTVTNTADSGAGSLRQAITDANANCTTDLAPVIQFNIPSGPFVISPASPLPQFTCSGGPYVPAIDGFSQPGATPNTQANGFDANLVIVLSGSTLSVSGCGLHFPSTSYGGALKIQGLEVRNFTYGGSSQGVCGVVAMGGNRIVNNSTGLGLDDGAVIGQGAAGVAPKRNVIGNNTNYGIDVAYGGNITVDDQFVGTLDGTSVAPNSVGIRLPGSASSVTNSLISGNSTTGIEISNDNGSVLGGNKIGTDASGTSGLPNAGDGVVILSGFGTTLQNNVISSNGDFGVHVGNADGVKLANNAIGTDGSGNSALPNLAGVSATCSDNLQLTGNVISGNSTDGVQLLGSNGGGAGLPHTGNKIGVGAGGGALANGGNGVLIDTTTCGAGPIASSGHFFASGTIANNAADGVALRAGIGNTLDGMSIYANGNKNININNTVGPLPNDAGDADGGPNNQQNYPVISLVTQNGTQTQINWSLNTTASTAFDVQFFSNPAIGNPAGKVFVGQMSGTTDASGNFTGVGLFAGLFDNISATARDGASLSTSEFSPMVALTLTPGVTITPPALAFGNVSVGSGSPSQSSTVTSSGNASYQITTFDTASTCYGAPLCYGGPFICSTNCVPGQAYAPGNSCTITASFVPTTLGPATGTIYLCDNSTTSPNTITLSGTGVPPPPLVVSPRSQDFGTVAVGGASQPPIIFNFANTGTAPAPISAPITTGPFQVVGTNCTTSIPPISSCNVNVSFTPTAAGPASGTVGLMSGEGTVTATLTGTGSVAPILALPSPIDLGGVLVGSTPSQVVTLTNTGAGVLTFSSITVTAPFTLSNSCGATLQPGESCTLAIGVDTSNRGSFSGTLTIVSDGGSGTVPLTVNVQPQPIPVIKISPTTVGFGDRIVGSTSASQRITITNDGGAAAAITGVTPSPDFVVVGNSCGTNLAPSASCFVDVAMRAMGFGGRVGELVIGSNASDAPHRVRLGGTGCRPFSATGVRTGPRSNCKP